MVPLIIIWLLIDEIIIVQWVYLGVWSIYYIILRFFYPQISVHIAIVAISISENATQNILS